MDDLIAYGGLFLFSLAAATILPFPSETALVGLLLADYSPWLLLAVASAGDVLSSTVDWLLGRAIDRYGTKAATARRSTASADHLGPDAATGAAFRTVRRVSSLSAVICRISLGKPTSVCVQATVKAGSWLLHSKRGMLWRCPRPSRIAILGLDYHLSYRPSISSG